MAEAAKINGGPENQTLYFETYPDFLLGGTIDQATLGPPGFAFDSDCNNGIQFGSGLGFYPTPVPNNTSSPNLPGQFIAGTYSSSVYGLITGNVHAARNPYGFLDLASTSPNTWTTFIYYNAADALDGSSCPIPTIQSTFNNSNGSGNPAQWAMSQVVITEQ